MSQKLIPKKLISIVVLNWNQPELTVNCIKSILRQDEQNFEIIIIDNASEDNSFEILKKEFKNNEKIRLIKNEKNLGYAGGNNIGTKLAKGEYIVILNNDTIVEKDWLKALISAIEEDKDTAIISSKVLERDKINVDFDIKSSYWTSNLFGYGVLAPHEKKKHFEAFQAWGCSFMFKKDMVGVPFDDDYFIYAEDTYLSWLTRLKGYKIRIAMDSVVRHYHNTTKKSSKKMAQYFIFLGERNTMLNHIIFYERKNLIKLVPLFLFGMIMRNVYEPKKIPQKLKSYIWLLVHPGWVYKKRKFIQSQRKVNDKEILKFLSSKIFEEARFSSGWKKAAVRLANMLSGGYCRLAGIKTIEANK